MAGLLIEIGVADAAVDGVVAETHICQIAGAVQADRDVAGQIGHVIVDAGVPAIGELWNEIGERAATDNASDRLSARWFA